MRHAKGVILGLCLLLMSAQGVRAQFGPGVNVFDAANFGSKA
jgi:hypothetical protein